LKIGYQTNTWGGVVGHPAGVTSVKDLYYLANGSTEQAVREIGAAGYQGIELFDGNLMHFEDRPDTFRKLLSDNRQVLVGVYCGANFIYRDIIDDELYKIDKAAKLAAELGAVHLVLGGGAIRSGGIRDADYQALADGLAQASAIAEKYGLIPSYHPHLGTIVQAPEQLDKLMAMTDIALCPDTAHIEAGGGDPVKVIKKYASRIPYVHFKDYSNGAFLPLGEGNQRFEEMLGILLENGYDGWITIELDSHENPAEGAGISMTYLKGILKIVE
jgi:inosose dehydratase